MATRSFLLKEEINEGLKVLLENVEYPKRVTECRVRFSHWLEERLMDRLKKLGSFVGLEPIFLGSWSRNELCPKSDIDLLFLGPEEKVRTFVEEAFRQGLKLRSRTPEDPNDWSVGVEPFDVLALASAKALTPFAQERLLDQQKLVPRMRAKILKAIREEREDRRRRQDSITAYLEPNLKFGAGGLRDIEQALSLPVLFPEVFSQHEDYAFKALKEIKDLFLFLRSLLHLRGSGDILTAHDQLDIAKELGVKTPGALMKDVQSELERASFYADWAVELAGQKKLKKMKVPETPLEAVKRLRKDPSLSNQYLIRRRVEILNKSLSAKATGGLLQKALSGSLPDNYLVALHRTRLFEVWIPDLKKIRGLVQHDHYHRYTADAHLVQSLREVERARTQAKLYGPLGRLGRRLGRADWWILKLTALFHDLAKGRDKDHSTEGALLVDKYFKAWGFSDSTRDDVRWLVENHLILSTAAFRQNPKAQSTWKRLFERGVVGRRLNLLALFTAIDIRATNPEAWTDWKSQLLYDLVRSMESSEAENLKAHLLYAKKKKAGAVGEWMLALDPVVLEALPPRVLIEDLAAAEKADGDLPVKVSGSDRKTWIRFHRRKDETGVFLNYVNRLYGLGLNIQTASVHTLPSVGVYDWFCVKTDKSPKQIGDWLNLPRTPSLHLPNVQFQSIDLMAQDQDEWIISFKGKDQRGLLLAAAAGLADQNLSLKWARVHTWGQQVEDIFSVRPFGEVEKVLVELRKRFVT